MLVTKDSTDGVLHPVAKMGELESFGQDRHQKADRKEQDERRPAPDNIIHCVVDICNDFQHKKYLFSLNSHLYKR